MAIKSYKTKRGTFYMFTSYLGVNRITRKDILITRRGFKTKREAQSAEAEYKYRYDNNMLDLHTDTTYYDVYKIWIKLYAKTVEDSTLNKAIQNFKLHILPAFGRMKLSEITPLDCQNFANEMSDKFAVLSKVYSPAKRVYEYARKIDLVSGDNPFDKVIRPKRKKQKKIVPFMNKEELRTLLGAIKSPLWYTFFFLLAHTGARRGEALACRWNDFDFQKGTWHICRAIAVGEDNVQYFSTTKTYTSDRVIDLDPELIQVLLNYRRKQKIKSIDGLIFSTKKGTMLTVTKPYNYLQEIIKKNDLKHVTIHSFRHTHCSMLFESGWTIKDVQERLGHKDMQTTMNIYLHITSDRKKKSMEQFINYLKEG